MAVARALGFQPEQVTLHQCYMGGGFGRRSLGDYAAEAARIAREVKRPVKLVWTREEDMAHGMFRPQDRKSTRLNSSHSQISYAVFCLKKKNNQLRHKPVRYPPLPVRTVSQPPRDARATPRCTHPAAAVQPWLSAQRLRRRLRPRLTRR